MTCAEAWAEPVLGWLFPPSLFPCSRVPLGANVEGVGGGVSHPEHGVWIAAGVRGPQFR